jgi:hypothetical protein
MSAPASMLFAATLLGSACLLFGRGDEHASKTAQCLDAVAYFERTQVSRPDGTRRTTIESELAAARRDCEKGDYEAAVRTLSGSVAVCESDKTCANG